MRLRYVAKGGELFAADANIHRPYNYASLVSAID
jgi:hypothetical protein